jgi:hypothetical protein
LTTRWLGKVAMEHGPTRALEHATAYLQGVSVVVVAWQWLEMSIASMVGLSKGASDRDQRFYGGKLAASRYWTVTDLPLAETRLRQLSADGASILDLEDEIF